MIFSAEKLEDIRLRNEVLYCMESAIRHGFTELARSFGETSRMLKERIDRGDYTERDMKREKVDMFLRRYEALTKHD